MKNRIDQIRLRIQQSAIACGRDPSSIKLVAASKSVSPERIETAIKAGLDIFGENYIQEAIKKIKVLTQYPIQWHFIGHLQSNKANRAVQYFDLIHTVDSLNLAIALDQQAKRINKIQKILIQVNVAGETTKSGIKVNEAISVVKDISRLENLSVMGLMTMPPYFNSPDKIRPFFRALAKLKSFLQEQSIKNINMNDLSMGMTGDFETAICEGATMVRIGTAIFGKRP
jgi:PLP dependent protein